MATPAQAERNVPDPAKGKRALDALAVDKQTYARNKDPKKARPGIHWGDKPHVAAYRSQLRKGRR